MFTDIRYRQRWNGIIGCRYSLIWNTMGFHLYLRAGSQNTTLFFCRRTDEVFLKLHRP